MLASYLTPKGFETVFAADALQAWTAALRSSPQLILLDINMPGGTGVEVLKRLRMSTRTQQIPVIVVSSEEGPVIEATVRGLGAAEFLRKPVEPNQFCATVDRVLNLSREAVKS